MATQALVLLINFAIIIIALILLYRRIYLKKHTNLLNIGILFYLILFAAFCIRKFIFLRGLEFESERELTYVIFFTFLTLIGAFIYYKIKDKRSNLFAVISFVYFLAAVFLLQTVYVWNGEQAQFNFRIGFWAW